jgi:hypothetical protein
VYKQPESPEEEALCKEAMEACPVEAIGNDSDEAALGALASDLEQSVDRGGFEAFTITNKNRMASADAQNQPYTYSSLLPDCIVRNLEQGYSPMPTS